VLSVEYIIFSQVDIDPNSGIFITMNPAGKGYGGRQKLPDNLKQLFRPVAMSKPDNELIAEVILFSEGFKSAKELGRKLVAIFNLSKYVSIHTPLIILPCPLSLFILPPHHTPLSSVSIVIAVMLLFNTVTIAVVLPFNTVTIAEVLPFNTVTIAVVLPFNTVTIAVVLLFNTVTIAEVLPFNTTSRELLTPQQHYDWGLRALKTILRGCGNLLQTARRNLPEGGWFTEYII